MASENDLKVIPLAEVAKHAAREDMWMVVHGKVYDVTEYLYNHPGGPEILFEQAGRDGTVAFEDVGHSASARGTLAKMLIGRLPEEEAKASAATSGKSSSGDASHGGSVLPYVLALLALGAAVWYQFFYTAAASSQGPSS